VIQADRRGSAPAETLGTDFAVDGLLETVKEAEGKALNDRSIADLIEMEAPAP